MANTGRLYIVATPIGHLKDISLRAIETLQTVDCIAAEDTRHSRRLLQEYQINTPTLSLHEHNEKARCQQLLSKLQAGQHIALISDAGTPLISDPGYRLVTAVRAAQIQVVPIPGACALITALSASGLPTDHFVFEGFLSAKKVARHKQLQQLKHETRTIILYESVHRIIALMDALLAVFGPDRYATIARELTKTFETIRSGSLVELVAWLQHDANQQKGEFVVLVQGYLLEDAEQEQIQYRNTLAVLLAELPLKQAVALAVKLTGGRKKQLYEMALEMIQETQSANTK